MNRTILMVQLWDKVKTLLSEKLTVAQVSLIPQIHDHLLEHYPDFPEEVVYDQDTIFLVDENYGKYHMTAELASYVLEAGYTPSFMMARDPQSKGKVENCVKYVKQNFLHNRTYTTLDNLNKEGTTILYSRECGFRKKLYIFRYKGIRL